MAMELNGDGNTYIRDGNGNKYARVKDGQARDIISGKRIPPKKVHKSDDTSNINPISFNYSDKDKPTGVNGYNEQPGGLDISG